MNNPVISYKKANKERRVKILKLYGVTDFEKLKKIIFPETKEVKCSMAELSRVLLNNPKVELKVSFQKMLKEKEIYDKIQEFYITTTTSEHQKVLKKVAKEIFNGTERICNGFHNGKLDAMNRLFYVNTDEKLDKTKNYDNRMILISLNHLNWVEVNDTKYILK